MALASRLRLEQLRDVAALLCFCFFAAGCSETGDDRIDPPDGWAPYKYADCCTVYHPVDLVLQPVGKTVEAKVVRFARPGLDVHLEYMPAQFDFDKQPTATQVSYERISVAGASGFLFRQAGEDGEVLAAWLRDPEPRGGSRGGETMQLAVKATCETPADCEVVDRMVRSARFTP